MPEDRARGPVLDGALDGRDRPQAAAELHGDRDPPADLADDPTVRALLASRVQVHHMEPPGSRGLEPHGDLDGVVVVHGLGRVVAAEEADASALAEVDGRDDDRAEPTSSTNDSYSWRPGSPDFSGWNCVANTFPRASTAENGRPCSARPIECGPRSGAYEWTK